MSETVQVAVRCRPLNEEEIQNKQKSCIVVKDQRQEIFLENPKKP